MHDSLRLRPPLGYSDRSTGVNAILFELAVVAPMVLLLSKPRITSRREARRDPTNLSFLRARMRYPNTPRR
jgi:hypothetical protein